MSDNPYRAPERTAEQLGSSPGLQIPAIALLVLSVLGAGCAVMGGVYWIPHLYHPDSTVFEHQLAVQTITFCGMNVLVCVVVFMGAVSMLRKHPRWLAITGAWAAVLPLCGPCFLLAIPFGIWALVVLSKPGVAATFSTTAK